ncbi:MAG: Gfo/Idh/MocA family oxidoreductase [Bacteroidetes bacterium]|nr:Gfo/Idh/MocA family oxidoreductase [Bacteroidota bacterium]
MEKKFNRREFVKTTSIITAGLSLGAASISAKSYSRIMGANERMNFGIIGLHGRAGAHLSSIAACKNTNVNYICDVDKRELVKFSNKVKDKFNYSASEVKDFRKLLESKDIDAITIATPEHWHTHMSIMGLQAGKHVYVEKPCSHNPREGELLVEAQKKYGKLVQLGNQQRSSPHTIKIIQKIKDGIIGEPYFGKAWYSNNRTSIGIGKEAPVPEYLDWELWQGPAPRTAYKDNIHPYNWHWFWNWGTGETLNNGTHEVDICRWALGVDIPNSIKSSGGRYHYKDDWEFYDTLITSFEYDNKMITWEGMSCNNKQYYGRGRGATIHGTNGTVLIDRKGYQLFDLNDNLLEEYSTSEKNDTQDILSMDSMTDLHFENFINAIRTGEKLRSPINEGNVSVTILQLSNIAWKLNRTLNLDKVTGHILNDSEAMEYWGREYEKGWEIKI